jgi:riboflavin kinase / FMN adenylyltransferase
VRLFRQFAELPAAARGAAVALGNFDGVHRGHRAVIGAAQRIAAERGRPSAVLTFEPHPRELFQPGEPTFRLTPFRIKARHIEALGIDLLFVLDFDRVLAAMSADDFIGRVLVDGLAAAHVVVGYDFLFGRGRRGTPATIAARAAEAGFGFSQIERIDAPAGVTFSSTAIRDRLAAGRADQAAALLGRWFELEGRVEHADWAADGSYERDPARVGALDFPTATVIPRGYIRPAVGVYAVRAGVDQGLDTVWHDGLANLMRRPAYDGRDTRLEVHLLDFRGDLYGRHLRVALVERLREPCPFESLDGLKAQIVADCAAARAVLASARPPAP